MQIFVTGPTGYIGTGVVTQLLRQGHSVTGLVRSDKSAAALIAHGAKAVRGTLQDLALLSNAARAADAVIHAGFPHDDWHDMEGAFRVDSEAVKTMLTALYGTNRPFIYTSGSGIVGDTGVNMVDEDVSPTVDNVFVQRMETEQLVMSAASEGVRSIVIRPGLVYGRGGGAVMQLLMSLGRDSRGPQTIGPGRNVWSAVHIDDLAELYLLALEKAGPGSIFNAANNDLTTFEDVARAAAKSLRLAGPVKAIPLEDARQFMGVLADGLVSEKRISSNRAASQLGWHPYQPSILSEIELGSYAPSPASDMAYGAGNSDERTMINNFTVPHAATESFLEGWMTDLAFMSSQPGFISGVLYRSEEENARYQFVNVAHWANTKTFKGAQQAFLEHFGGRGVDRRAEWEAIGIKMSPSVYTVQKKF